MKMIFNKKNKYEEMTDNELIKLSDKLAIQVLYERYIENIYKYVFYKTSLKEVAEDITSETFLAAFSNLQKYSFNSSFKTYLFGICKHKITDYYRSKYKEEKIDLDLISDTEEILEDVDNTIEKEKEKLLKIISKLNVNEKIIIEKRYLHKQKFIDIADDLKISLSNVKVLHFRAIKKLRENYEK